jgi:hypothetical protein
MRVLLTLWFSAAATAQTLAVTSSAAGRGESGSFLIRLDAPPAAKLAALQWQIRVPIEVVIDHLYIAAGSATVSADKTLSCLRSKSDRNHAVYHCVVYGGKKAIAGGTVAVVQYQVSPRAKAALPVEIDNAMAASPDAEGIPIAPAQGSIALK